MGLSRNIISIHLTSDSILSIEKGTSNSIKSGYDLYLKENVKQYIEIKNKISEFIQVQSDKSLEITKNMFSMFKTGLWTFTTFFITVFLLRVLSKESVLGAFSKEVYLVSLLLITFSIIYLIISVIEINSDRDRLLKKYSDFKNRYKDLLDKKDLNKILDDDKVKEEEKEYINRKRNQYSLFWIFTNILLFIIVTVLFLNNAPVSPTPTPNHTSVTIPSLTPSNQTQAKINQVNTNTLRLKSIKAVDPDISNDQVFITIHPKLTFTNIPEPLPSFSNTTSPD